MMTRYAAAVAALLALSISGCSGGEGDPAGGTRNPPPSTGAGGVAPGGGPSDDGKGGADPTPSPLPPPPAGSKACELPAMTATDVSPKFLTYDPPASEPPAQKGGKIDGKYTVDKATVYLPTSTKGLVKMDQSTGTVNGWATFSGKDYRLSLKTDLQIKPIIGAVQEQKIDAQGQGTFSTKGETITLDTACPGSNTPEASVTFSENGDRGTLVVKTPIEGRGDAYILLEAARVK